MEKYFCMLECEVEIVRGGESLKVENPHFLWVLRRYAGVLSFVELENEQTHCAGFMLSSR